MDETKVQIGEDVLLDIGIHSDWYISSIGYDGESVDVALRRKADRKTENSSEKPNNCEVKNYCDDCLYNDACDSKEFFYACTSKATISKMEQVDEPKTQMKTQNSNLIFEKRKCIDCNFLTYMFGKTWCNIKCDNPHDKVCDRFKPKDEQTDCAWK